MVSNHAAVSLFEGKNHLARPCLLQLFHPLSKKAKARKGIIARDAVVLRYGSGHIGCHNGFKDNCLLRQPARPSLGTNQVVKKEYTCLVAGEGEKFP